MATGANSEVRIPRADGEEDVYPPPDPQVVQLVNKPLGLWEMTTSDTDVITTASLLEKAKWHLGDKGNVRPSYKLMLEPGIWQPIFGVGDIVMLRIDTVRANVKVPIRIEELAIVCTSDGAETVSMSVRAEEPETPISAFGGQSRPVPQLLAAGDEVAANGRTVQRHRLSEADDLGALLRSMRKRLDRAERSRGMGGGTGAGILDGFGPPPASIGSPGDYYVDMTGRQLYGPKAEGTLGLSASAATTHRDHDTGGVVEVNNVLLNQEVAIGGYCFKDMDIIAFRWIGAPTASATLNVSFWDYDSKELLYRTTRLAWDRAAGWRSPRSTSPPSSRPPAAAASDGSPPPSAPPPATPPCPSGQSPRGDYGYPSWMVLYFGVLPGRLGQAPGNQSGAHSLDLQLMTRPSEGTVIGPEELGVNEGWPNAHFLRRAGHERVFWNPGGCSAGATAGWRTRRRRSRSVSGTRQRRCRRARPRSSPRSPSTTKAKASSRCGSRTRSTLDGFLFQDYLMISYGHPDGVPYANSEFYNAYPASGWWGFQNDASQDDVVGKFPIYSPATPPTSGSTSCRSASRKPPSGRGPWRPARRPRPAKHPCRTGPNIERPYSGYDYTGPASTRLARRTTGGTGRWTPASPPGTC